MLAFRKEFDSSIAYYVVVISFNCVICQKSGCRSGSAYYIVVYML